MVISWVIIVQYHNQEIDIDTICINFLKKLLFSFFLDTLYT